MTKKVYLQPYYCLGCEDCVEACAKEHGFQSNSFVEWVNNFYPVSIRCMHCEDAPCVKVCPTSAISIDKKYGVQVDVQACIGCGSCKLACPFGIPQINPNTGKMAKCDLCIDRQKRGLQPACVENCPYSALVLVDPEEMASSRREQNAGKSLAAGINLVAAANSQEGC